MKRDTKTLAADLRRYNAWRRGDDSHDQMHPKLLGDLIEQSADRLEQHGDPTDEANPNGSTFARLKWWKGRADDLHEQIADVLALADRLAETLDGLDWLAAEPPKALAAWKEARK